MQAKQLLLASLLCLTAAPGLTKTGDPSSSGAPQASDRASYCLRVEATVGTRIESVVCRTRAEWAEWDVDVDQEWAKEGVRVIDG